MRRLLGRPVMSGLIDDHEASFFFSISFSFAHAPFIVSIHHHPAHLHWLENDPDADRVEDHRQHRPWGHQHTRAPKLKRKTFSEAPGYVESEQKPKPQHEQLH